jgi:hypothetical protein
MKRLAIVCLAAMPLALTATAAASNTQTFHATFHNVSFQTGCSPQTVPIPFCGSGTVAGYGTAAMIVRVTKNVPIPGSPCADVAGLRWITLDDGSGTLVVTFSGVRCPLGAGGKAFRVELNWTVDPSASSGVFAGATGEGTGVNTTAGNVQVVSMSGTITTP